MRGYENDHHALNKQSNKKLCFRENRKEMVRPMDGFANAKSPEASHLWGLEKAVWTCLPVRGRIF